MRAIILEKFGGLDSLVYKDVPEPKAGHIVIEIKAFGINHAEEHMRRGEWAEAASIIGIECVGIVKSCPGGEFPVGAKVAAVIESNLAWAELAAIPETYATGGARIFGIAAIDRAAWTCLFRNLEIESGQLLVIRGATSSFGQAALKMARNAGARVIATSRNPDRFPLLEKLGAERCEIERRDL